MNKSILLVISWVKILTGPALPERAQQRNLATRSMLLFTILLSIAAVIPTKAQSPSIKGLIITVSSDNPNLKETLFTDLTLPSPLGDQRDDVVTVTDQNARILTFKSKEIGKIIYFNPIFYEQLHICTNEMERVYQRESGQWQRHEREDIQKKEIGVPAGIYSGFFLTNKDLKSLQEAKVVYESLNQSHPHLDSLIQPNIDRINNYIRELNENIVIDNTPPGDGYNPKPVTDTTSPQGAKYQGQYATAENGTPVIGSPTSYASPPSPVAPTPAPTPNTNPYTPPPYGQSFLSERGINENGVPIIGDGGNDKINFITTPLPTPTLGPASGGNSARFNDPCGVTVDGRGNIYVADTGNYTIRKITPDGVVTTLAGSLAPPGSSDTSWMLDSQKSIPKMVSPGSNDGTGSAAKFYLPWGIATDQNGILYVADTGNDIIRTIMPSGMVANFVGAPISDDVVAKDRDGTGKSALLDNPQGLALDGNGNLYVADSVYNTIRKITPSGVVTTLAGSSEGKSGSSDGTGSAARFNGPVGVAVDGKNNIYVADGMNQTIRRITPSGIVTTLAGSAGESGSSDGTGSMARFSYPEGVAVDASGNVYVADRSNHTIRKITPSGIVTTLAGSAGESGSSDGTGSMARFSYPEGVAVDASGNVYVGDAGNNTIRKITPDGVVTTIAGSAGQQGNNDSTGSVTRQ